MRATLLYRAMPIHPVATLDDPRVAPYRNLKDRELAAEGGRFIAEGEHVVRRLLASDFPVESVLLAQRRVEDLAPLVPPATPVYTLPDELLTGVVGFKFHSGVLGVAHRKPNPALETVLSASRPFTLVVCPEIINTDNLGSLIRISAAFGADAMLIGERSCDPFWRRSIRVSMGAVFTLPIIRSADLLADLQQLKRAWQVEMIATVIDAAAEPLETTRRPPPPNRLALFFGSESQGLHRRWLAQCDRRVTIPMQHGTDSLNVAIAAAVFLYHFTRGR